MVLIENLFLGIDKMYISLQANLNSLSIRQDLAAFLMNFFIKIEKI